MSKSNALWWTQAIVINFFVIIILFFFTTPLIVINNLNEIKIDVRKATESIVSPSSSNIKKKGGRFNGLCYMLKVFSSRFLVLYFLD